MKERIQKIIANSGVASRRAAEKIMVQGRVKVNGELVTEMGSMADLEIDIVEVDGVLIKASPDFVYVALNKPLGIVSTCKDTHDRPTLNSLNLPDQVRLYPVGRLDMDSSGLIILTNDGDFANRMMHPSSETYKTYLVEVRGYLNETDLDMLRSGIQLTDGITLPAIVDIVAYGPSRTRLTVAIREGRNRQIRRMMGAIYHPVETLSRIAIGKLELGELKQGQWRYLEQSETKMLLSDVRDKFADSI